MKLSHLIILLVLNACWAAVYSAYKVLGQTLPTGAIVTLRFGLAGLILLIAWPWLPGAAPKNRDLLVTVAMGLMLYVAGQRLQVYGNEIGTAGNSAVLMAFEPVLTSVAAAIFLRERVGPRRLAGFALGMIGVLLLNGFGRADFQWAGLGPSLIVLASFVCEAAYSVAGKPIVTRASPMKMLAISLAAGGVVNVVLEGQGTLAAARSLSMTGWVLIVAMALICTVIGYSAWFLIIRDCPINVAALTIFAQSVFGLVIAALWVKEPLHVGQLWGSVAIFAGLLVGLSRQIRT